MLPRLLDATGTRSKTLSLTLTLTLIETDKHTRTDIESWRQKETHTYNTHRIKRAPVTLTKSVLGASPSCILVNHVRTNFDGTGGDCEQRLRWR